MKVLRGHPGEWEPGATRRAVAIGVFDGLHLGHRRVLDEMKAGASSAGLETCVVTFDPHPLTVVAPEHAPPLLTSVEQRIELLEAQGVAVVAVVPFRDDVRGWSPATFVSELLVDRVGAALVVVGEDFRFGRDRTGHVGLLQELGGALGFDTCVVSLVGSDRPVSSSRIRAAIAEGDVAAAAEALGRPHEVVGAVVPGAGRGGSIGVPTANLSLPEGIALPSRGVYAVTAGRSVDEVLPGVANLGVRPTFGGGGEVLEVHLLDADLDVSGAPLRVRFVDRIREERQFPDAEALVAQIHQDIVMARKVLQQAESSQGR